MLRAKKSEGFAILEGILLVVVIGVIGFAGWFVWHSKQAADKAAEQANSAESSTGGSKELKYISLSQWGVEAPYNGPLQLSYKITDNEAVFSSKSLTDLYPGCEGYAGTIDRYGMIGMRRSGHDGPFDNPANTTKIIENYGYIFVHAQSECAGSTTDPTFAAHKARIDAELMRANDAVQSLVQHLTIDSCATEPELSAPCAKKNGLY